MTEEYQLKRLQNTQYPGTQKLIELGKRAVALEGKGFRWTEGMWTLNPKMPHLWYPRVGRERTPQHRFLLPDFSDPATLGCLRHLAAKAHGGFDVTVYEVKGHDTPTGKWAVLDKEGRTIKWGIFDLPQSRDFTAWGLVEALEAAE